MAKARKNQEATPVPVQTAPSAPAPVAENAGPVDLPDSPLTQEELKNRGLYLDQSPKTPKAHAWTKQERINYEPCFKNSYVAEAKRLGRQLNLAETQAVTASVRAKNLSEKEADQAEREARRALYEPRPDTDVPMNERGYATCENSRCGKPFRASTWNVVKDGVVVVYREGPKAGEVIRHGNVTIAFDDPDRREGPHTLVLCDKCRRDFQDAARDAGRNARFMPMAEVTRVVEAIENSARRREEAEEDRRGSARNLAFTAGHQRSRYRR